VIGSRQGYTAAAPPLPPMFRLKAHLTYTSD